MAAADATPLTLRRAAGQVLIAGLEGTTLSAAETAWLRLIQPGGVILFRRNVAEPRQTHALLRAVERAADPVAGARPLLRCIDVEGGTVDRLRDMIAPLPSAGEIAAAHHPKLFAQQGWLAGRELRMLGLNVDFAPVLDLKTSASAPVMGSRVHSGDPTQVAVCAGYFLDGLTRGGVLGCGKHFPGLGGGGVDSHSTTPRIEKSFAALWQDDLLPYRELAARLPLVMVSHAAFPRTPSKSEPASISRFWITEILRKRIGFRGLVVSDDMEMGGILSHTTISDAAVRTLLAGTHLIEICHQPALIFSAYEALLSEAERSPAFARRLRQSAAQVERFKRERLRRDFPPAPTASNALKVRAALRNFSDSLDPERSAKRAAGTHAEESSG